MLDVCYCCEDIGDLLLPSSDAIKIYIEAFKVLEKASQSMDRCFSNISGSVQLPACACIRETVACGYRGVAQSVECLLWEQKVVGSNPAAPTKII